MPPLTHLQPPAPIPYGTAPASAARQFLANYWDGELPVNPVKLARLAGLQVVGVSGVDYSGWYERDAGRIEINTDEPRVRQRFTAAHELGHYVLGHDDSPRDNPTDFSVRSSNPQERAANQFAAELLMPADVTRRMVQSGRASSVEELASVFGVSKVAMSYRMNNLDLSY